MPFVNGFAVHTTTLRFHSVRLWRCFLTVGIIYFIRPKAKSSLAESKGFAVHSTALRFHSVRLWRRFLTRFHSVRLWRCFLTVGIIYFIRPKAKSSLAESKGFAVHTTTLRFHSVRLWRRFLTVGIIYFIRPKPKSSLAESNWIGIHPPQCLLTWGRHQVCSRNVAFQ